MVLQTLIFRHFLQFRSAIFSTFFILASLFLADWRGYHHYNVAHTYIPHLVKSGEGSCAGVVPEHNIKAHISFLFW